MINPPPLFWPLRSGVLLLGGRSDYKIALLSATSTILFMGSIIVHATLGYIPLINALSRTLALYVKLTMQSGAWPEMGSELQCCMSGFVSKLLLPRNKRQQELLIGNAGPSYSTIARCLPGYLTAMVRLLQ